MKKKLFKFRFRNGKQMIQIYKIFEIETEILNNLIEYHNNPNPSKKQQQDLLKIKERIKSIINFKKKKKN